MTQNESKALVSWYRRYIDKTRRRLRESAEGRADLMYLVTELDECCRRADRLGSHACDTESTK